jgi:hypothetical protein
VKQVVHRLADCWRFWGEKHGYFASSATDAQVFYDELVYSLLNQESVLQIHHNGLIQVCTTVMVLRESLKVITL